MKKLITIAGLAVVLGAASARAQDSVPEKSSATGAVEQGAEKVEKKKEKKAAKKKAAKEGKATVSDKQGIKIEESKVGDGKTAETGKKVDVHYTGWLLEGGKKGKKFDSSVDRGQPFSFLLGAGQVIQGWDIGVEGMKVGGKRTLTIPPEKGYGGRAVGGGLIPANSTLVFDVELLDVK